MFPRLLVTVLGGALFVGALVSVVLTGFPLSLSQVLGLIAGIAGILSGWRLHSKRALLTAYTLLLVTGTIAAVPLIESLWIDQHLILKEHRAEMIDDPRLIKRTAPYSGGHDANGFRNDTVPDHADMITLGDSQTWGYNVERSDTWPRLIEKLTGQSVYNMGTNDFGPVEYWVLTGDALQQFSPKTIIVGLYLGNDLYDAYESIYQNETFAQFRLPQPDDELFLDTIQEIFETISFSEKTVRYEDKTTGTVFTPIRRLLALEDTDKRIAEGMRITELMLLEMADQTRAAGVRLIVLLIPTKELVYAGHLPTGKSASYDLVIRRETRLREQIMALLDQHGIEFIDVLPTWRAALDQNQAIYRSDNDGHPTAEGHRLLASLVDGYLEQPRD